MKRLIYWLAAALLVSGVYLTIYAAVQHSLRVGANDPQIQLAEDTAVRLGQGHPAADSLGDAVDVAASLAPFLIVYDPSGAVVASSARLAGRTPTLPAGVLGAATPGHASRLTWQPRPGVRLASVVVTLTRTTQRSPHTSSEMVSTRTGERIHGRSHTRPMGSSSVRLYMADISQEIGGEHDSIR